MLKRKENREKKNRNKFTDSKKKFRRQEEIEEWRIKMIEGKKGLGF